jgi:phosphoribosylformylglycinamidine (FGAM) synthase-like enzyme
VSFYNETDGRAVLPTPILGVVGLVDDVSHVRTRLFADAGLDIVIVGEGRGELGGSEYLKTIHGLIRGRPPVLDLARERALARLLVDWASRGVIRSAHDCAEGGLAVTLAECCFDTGGLGADVSIGRAPSDGGVPGLASTLFGESATCVLVSAAPADAPVVLREAHAAGLPAARIGRTGGSAIRIAIDGAIAIDCSVGEAEARWSGALAKWLDGRAA